MKIDQCGLSNALLIFKEERFVWFDLVWFCMSNVLFSQNCAMHRSHTVCGIHIILVYYNICFEITFSIGLRVLRMSYGAERKWYWFLNYNQRILLNQTRSIHWLIHYVFASLSLSFESRDY